MATTIPEKLPIQYRQFHVDLEQFKERAAEGDDRRVELSFSSETDEVERWGDVEILDHKKSAVRMGRLKNGAPLLLNHDSDKQVGVIESASIKDKRGVATVRFGNSPLANEIYQDVKDGIRRNVSVGYRIHAVQREKKEEGRETWRVTDWEPLEISIVAVPADSSVGVGRSTDNTENPVRVDAENGDMLKNRTFLEPDKGDKPPAPTVDVVKERADAKVAERTRLNEIEAFAVQFPQVRDLANKAKDGDVSADEFRKEAFAEISKSRKVSETPDIGMSEKDIRKFSLLGAVRSMATRGRLEGFEAEVCEAARKQMKRELKDPRAFVIPAEVSAARALNVGTATAGGFTVETEYGSMIEFLRNRTVLGQLGITILDGLVGDFVMPQQTGGAAAYWVSENGTITDSEATFAQKSLKPNRLGACIPFTMQFLTQSSLSAESFVRNELDIALGLKKDSAGLYGAGVSGEPLGLANTTGINATVTYGGAATWADVVEHETGIAVDNADIGSMGFALSATTVGKWKTILKDSVAGAGYLIGENGMVNGYPYKRTNQITDNKSFFGVWSQLIMGVWAGREITVDNITLAKTGQIQIIVQELVDFLVRQPLAFNVSTDSAAQ